MLNSIARQKLGKMSCFQCVDDNFIESLSLTVVGELYDAGDGIINVDDDSDCMYFIMNGTIEVVGASGEVHADMGAGSFFGEVGIFFGVKRTASIRAKDNVILFKLTKQALMEVSENYPSFQRRIKEEANERYKCYTERQEANSSDPVELFDVEVSEKHLMLVCHRIN
jgi:F-box/leucine-rich repeat protein 7